MPCELAFEANSFGEVSLRRRGTVSEGWRSGRSLILCVKTPHVRCSLGLGDAGCQLSLYVSCLLVNYIVVVDSGFNTVDVTVILALTPPMIKEINLDSSCYEPVIRG